MIFPAETRIHRRSNLLIEKRLLISPQRLRLEDCQIIDLRQVLSEHSWISRGDPAWSGVVTQVEYAGNPGRIRAVILTL